MGFYGILWDSMGFLIVTTSHRFMCAIGECRLEPISFEKFLSLRQKAVMGPQMPKWISPVGPKWDQSGTKVGPKWDKHLGSEVSHPGIWAHLGMLL